jgi:hypothetical protein
MSFFSFVSPCEIHGIILSCWFNCPQNWWNALSSVVFRVTVWEMGYLLSASEVCADWCNAREVYGPSTTNVNVKEYIFMCYYVVQGNGNFAVYLKGYYESSFLLSYFWCWFNVQWSSWGEDNLLPNKTLSQGAKGTLVNSLGGMCILIKA